MREKHISRLTRGELHVFPAVCLPNSLKQSPRDWKAWFLSAKPEESPLPGDWESKCSDLQRLCVLRSLRADRILFSAATYVSNNLGPQFADPPAFDLKVNYAATLFRVFLCGLELADYCIE